MSVTGNGCTIENLTFDGNRANNSPSSPGQVHNLRILSVNEVTVRNVEARSHNGDGICHTGDTVNGASGDVGGHNCTYESIYCWDNNRHGMAISGGRSITVANSHFFANNGTDVNDGVDVETASGRHAEDLAFDGCHFYNNDWNGIKIDKGIDEVVTNSTSRGNGQNGVMMDNAVECKFTSGIVKNNSNDGV